MSSSTVAGKEGVDKAESSRRAFEPFVTAKDEKQKWEKSVSSHDPELAQISHAPNSTSPPTS
jgi:hypothetical protein